MSQSIFLDPTVSSLPVLAPGSVGTGTLTVDKLSHFTVTQDYTAVCTATSPFTVFDIIGSLDGPVGVAIVGQQFEDQDKKIFLTINQGPLLFEVGDTFNFSVEQGTDLTQTNLDTYDELPQKNFGVGVIGQNKGDHNIRFNEAAQLAFREIQNLRFTSVVPGALGNLISVEYLQGTVLTAASLTIQDITYTANLPGVDGNDIEIEYLEFDPAIAATAVIQDISYTSKLEGTLGNVTSIEYIGGGTAGSETATLIGDKIQVEIDDGVSTADQVRIAIGINPATFALLDGISTGTGLELQSIQVETFLLGGVDAVGDAGNEVVDLNGNSVTVKLESGVSTAQNVYDAVIGNPSVLSILTPVITGTPATTQIAPVANANMTGGADDLGIPGSELVIVDDNEIKVYFDSGASTADQIKTAVENSVEASALVNVTLLGVGTEFQTAPVNRIFLGGGLGVGTFAFNTKELTDAGSFNEGNASILATNITNQGDETTSGETLKRGKVTLDDNEVTNESGPKVENTQKTINNLIQNGKALFFSEDDGKINWSKPAGTISSETDLKILFVETGVVNTILQASMTLLLADGEHLWVEVDRKNNINLTVNQGVLVPDGPNGENIFRLVSRVGDSLIWWDNTLQREGKKLRIGEGAGTGAYQEKIGTANGVQTDFPIASGLFPVNESSILVFSNSHSFITTEWSWDDLANSIIFVDPPEIGTEIYIYFLTDGDSVSPPSVSGIEQSYIHTVSVTEAMNKELQLLSAPTQPSKVMVDIVGGTTQALGFDFNISGDLFNWSGLALDGDLSSGDKVRFHFFS